MSEPGLGHVFAGGAFGVLLGLAIDPTPHFVAVLLVSGLGAGGVIGRVRAVRAARRSAADDDGPR